MEAQIVDKAIIRKFFINKTILRSYNYSVIFQNIANDFPFPTNDEDFFVRSVRLPQYEFKKEVINYGPFPFTYPVMESDGLEISMVLEETNKGSITKLVERFKQSIIDSKGRYRPQILNKFTVIVLVTDNSGKSVFTCTYPQCYFLKASELNFDYSTNDLMTYELTLVTDFVETEIYN